MTTLWDTTGSDVVKALSAERRSAGAMATGLALTLVVVTDQRSAEEAEKAATAAAAAHPCRLLMVIRRHLDAPDPRLDAEVLIGGRLGPGEAVVMRMYGRLALHAESVCCRCSHRTRPSSRGGTTRCRTRSRSTRSACSPTGGSPKHLPLPIRWPRCTSERWTTPRATPTWPGPGPPAGARWSRPRSTRCRASRTRPRSPARSPADRAARRLAAQPARHRRRAERGAGRDISEVELELRTTAGRRS